MKVLVFKDIKYKRWILWSVDRKNHLGYRSELSLKNYNFFVDDAKRKKIAKSKKRFPHAWIIGELDESPEYLKKEVIYNPFVHKGFISNGKIISHSKKAIFNEMGQVFI
jgi:hypothetical protein